MDVVLNNVTNCSVRNKIWVASCIPPQKCPVRDVICCENITYLTARPFLYFAMQPESDKTNWNNWAYPSFIRVNDGKNAIFFIDFVWSDFFTKKAVVWSDFFPFLKDDFAKLKHGYHKRYSHFNGKLRNNTKCKHLSNVCDRKYRKYINVN